METLLDMAKAPPAPDATSRLRQALLDAGSETPDNLAAAARVEYGPQGLAVAGRSLCDLVNQAEGMAPPPGVSQPDWDAALRVIVLLLADLEPDSRT
jgi:hypothetical protein